ncbi:glycosyltransferase family 4 protein [Algibacter sp. R77976]|uniref:glycosyltransferase family 4 protein n=1 Tax=Algibacter sp. R77976 TaxID=3093873 RepID=UPI0037C611D8
MKTIVYIGNKGNSKSSSNLSSIDVLGPLLGKSGYTIFSASQRQNIILRLLEMLWVCFKNRKKANYVIIDTYSTLNFYYAYIVSQFCRILKLKYIPILHGGNLPERLKTAPKLSKYIFKNAFVNVAPSLYMKSNFEALGYNNIINIPNSIELENYTFKERNFDSVNLLWVRSFSEIYNPLLAIKVLKALKEKNIKAKLCMVGPDSNGGLQEARDFAKKLNVDVRFTGKLSKQEWAKLSEDYNIFINTTNFDNMPVSVIEAMALGLPVVSTNVGGIPFLIDNKVNGLLVNPNSINEFLDAINSLIKDQTKTNKIIKQARVSAERFDWKAVEKLWIKVLE